MKSTTIAWISDLHTGSPTGLSSEPKNEVQEELLDRFKDAREWFGDTPDYTIVVGDTIDGQDRKSKDLDEHWIFRQAEDAASLITDVWMPKKEIILVGGTFYHTAIDGQDMERHVFSIVERNIERKRKKVKASYRHKMKAVFNDWYRVEARHKIGRSTVPYSRKTAPERYKYWNVISAAMRARRNSEVPIWPHLCVFAHVHYCGWAGDPAGVVYTLPCWQATGSIYGERDCEGIIDVGMLKTVVGEDENSGAQNHAKTYDASVVDRWEKKS
jgi:hypothetical protein